MIISLNSVLGIIQILLQAIAVFYSYKIYSFNRLSRGWLAVSFALVLMTFRRITALLIELKILPNLEGWLAHVDRIILPTLISIFLLIGLYGMFKNFENFDVVEKKVKKLAKNK